MITKQERGPHSERGVARPARSRADELWRVRERDIARNIRQLNTAGAGANNFLIVSAGTPFVQLLSSFGSKDGIFEAVSNYYLPPELALSSEAIARLRTLGFRDPNRLPQDELPPAAEAEGIWAEIDRRLRELGVPQPPAVATGKPRRRARGSPNFWQYVDLTTRGNSTKLAQIATAALRDVYRCSSGAVRVELTLDAGRRS